MTDPHQQAANDLIELGHRPFHWIHETTGILRPAVEAYLGGDTMTTAQVATMRAYLRQWIAAPAWRGRRVRFLRRSIDSLASQEAIASWIKIAEEEGIDPL